MIFRHFYILCSLLVLLTAFPSSVYTQSLKVDRNYVGSLLRRASTENDEKKLCRLYNLIAEEYIKSYTIDSSKNYSRLSLLIASENGWLHEEARALINLVKANRANQFNSEYLTTRRESFESINRAVELCSRLGDTRSLAECYFLFSTYYMFHEKYNEVLNYNRKAFSLYSSLNDSAGIGTCLGYFGTLYFKTGNPDSSQACMEQSLRILESVNNTDQVVYILQGLVYLKIAQKKPLEAVAYVERAVKLAEGSENLFMTADISNDYAAALIAAGRSDEALVKLNRACGIAHRFGAQILLSYIYTNYADAYRNKGDFRLAAMYKDSIIAHSQNYEAILRQSALENEIYYRELEQKRQEVQLKYYKLAFVTLLLGAITFFFFFNARQKHRTNRLLEQKNSVISNQNEELDQINRELEKRVLERTEDLIQAKEKAEAADRMKSSFLAQMSHEIRTPVNTILSFVSLIKTEMGGSATEDVSEGFSIIEKGSRRLIRTIDMILTMSQFQAGNYEAEFTRLDMCKDVLCKLHDEFSQQAKAKELSFSIIVEAEDTAITADEYSMLQLFQNLIDNAIKYTKKGFVGIRVYRENAGNISVDISDSGIGISEEYLPHLFDSFSQEETGYTRRFEGNGLGLALVKKYAEINGISISVRSRKGSGTTFTLTFSS